MNNTGQEIYRKITILIFQCECEYIQDMFTDIYVI